MALPAAGGRFLAVEDDPIIQRAIARAVAGRMEVRLAGSGSAALEAISADPLPAFVLLDYMLPDTNGLQVLQALRANERTQIIPVVMFTSRTDASLAQEALAAGANSWVRKPDEPEALRAIIQAICEYWGGVHSPTVEPPARPGRNRPTMSPRIGS